MKNSCKQINSDQGIRALGPMLAVCFCLVLMATMHATTSTAAEEETTVLTIRGDLIGSVEKMTATLAPEQIIARYYALLAIESRQEAEASARDLASLFNDFDIAFSAADTAEVNGLLSEIAHRWAVIRTLHAREFTPEVIAELREAYGRLYPPIAERQ